MSNTAAVNLDLINDEAIEQQIIKDVPFKYRDHGNLVESYEDMGYTKAEALEAAGAVLQES